MSQIAKHLPLSVPALVVVLFLAGCGGGDGSPPPQPTQSSGYAVDGYLQNAAVLCDSDGNGVPSVGEVTATTTSGGLFTFPEGCGSGVVVTGGTNADTRLPFTGTLRSPAGATAATPLTSLMVAGLTQDQLNVALGLPAGTDIANTDPAATADGALVHSLLMKKTAAVQQLLQKTAEMLNGLTAAPEASALPGIYAEVVTAYADFLKGGRKLSSTDTTLDVAVVGELVKVAATRVASAPTLSLAVRNAAKSVNAGALGGVTAGGLQVQAEALLKTTTAQSLTVATEQQQTDTQITEYVVANKAALAGTPTAEVVNSLSRELTAQVKESQTGGGGGGGGESGNTGTCLAATCVDFAGASVGLGAFGDDGGGFAAIDNDPNDAANKVARIVKKPGDQPYLGASIYTNGATKSFDPPIVLTATNNTITLRVFSPAIGEKMLLKVENLPADGSASQQVQVSTTKANAWETMSFTFAGPGTYNTISVLPHFDTAVTAETTFYIDELKRPVPGTGGGGGSSGDIDFSDPNAGLGAFGDNGGGFAVIDSDPTDAANKVAKIVKKPGDKEFLGASVYTNAAAKAFDPPVVLTAVNNTITLRVYSPAVGEKILLKVENLPDSGSKAQEIQVVTTKAKAWEVLSFTFPNAGTYNTISILPHFGTTVSAETTFYFDDLTRPAPATGGPDTTPPTVTISDNVPGDNATGSVIFTFSFSESVGSSFTADDVDVTGGTKGAFTVVGGAEATLVVTPPLASKGTVKVSVAAGKFADAGGNLNAATAAAQQAFDTTGGGTGGSIDFSNPNVGLGAFGDDGGGYAAIDIDPTNALNKVAKIVKKPGDKEYLGASIYTDAAAKTFNPPVVLTATNNTLSIRVYSPAVGEKILLKLESLPSGSAAQQIEVTTTKAKVWETLYFTFPNAGTYNTVSILPHFGTTVSAETTFYFDDLAGPLPGGPDVTAPTVTITDNAPGATATGAVTFTFTFSESVGTTFTAEDVVVTGGAKGLFTLVSVTQATLVVTPPAASTGTLGVSVAASKFSDAAGNANTAAATAAQAFDTTVAAVGTVLVSFDEPVPPYTGLGAFGGALPTVEAGPAGGTGNSLKILKPASPDTWGGAYFTVPAIPFAADRKTLTARVYSTRAGAVIRVKVEAGGVSTEVASAPTGAANTWSTVTWYMASVDATKAYTTIAITPDRDLPTTGQAYYFDDITLAPAGVQPPAAKVPVMATFDEVPPPALLGFNGAEGTTIATAPVGGSGKAARIVRSGGDPWAGAVVTTGIIPFSSTALTITARVYSPKAGIPMVLKLEGPAAVSSEFSATSAVVVGWQTLTWVLNGLDLANVYDKVVMLPDLGTVAPLAGDVYYFDDLTLVGTVVTGPLTIATLDEPKASLTGFEGCYDSTLVDDPAGGPGKVGKVVKPGSGVPFYCGSTVVTVANGGFTPIPFSDTAKTMTVRFWSPTTGTPVRLKVEDITDQSKSVETEATTTRVGWQTLTFNFANHVTGTTALNLATTYNKVSIFFKFGSVGTGETYYFDDITFVTGTGTNTVVASYDERNFDNTQSQPSILIGFGGAEDSTIIGYADVGVPADGGKTGKLAKVVKNAGEVFAGTATQRKVNDAVPTIPFTTGATKMSVRVYSAYPGMRVHMKVEQSGRPDFNSEVDAFTTLTNTWETLVFDFGPAGKHFVPNGPGPNDYDQTKPTSQLDVTKTFNKVNIFFDYGLGDAGYAAMPSTRTYYFDDVKFVGQ